MKIKVSFYSKVIFKNKFDTFLDLRKSVRKTYIQERTINNNGQFYRITIVKVSFNNRTKT